MLNKRIKIIIITIIFSILFNNASHIIYSIKANNQQYNDLKVVVSLSMIGDWVQNIAGDLFTITDIVSGLENPHTYDPSPSEVAAVASADIFINFGLAGLEPWVNSVLQSSPPSNILTLINTSIDEYMQYDPIIAKMNPHVWMSPINAKNMTFKIYKAFADLNPENNNTLFSNFLSYQNDLNSLLSRIDQSKKTFNGTKVVVHHPAFMYFLDLVGIKRIGAIEETEGAEPSAAHIAEITQKILDEKCELIISQPQIDEELIKALAIDTKAKIAVLTPLLGVEVEAPLKAKYGNFIDEYIEMFDYNLYKLANPYTPSIETTIGFDVVAILGFITFIITMTIIRKRNSIVS